MPRSRKIMAATLALLVAAAALLGVYSMTRVSTAQGAKTVTVTVVHGDASVKTFTYHTNQEYLGPLLQQEGLVQGEDGQFGLYVTTVDGETADYSAQGSYWALYQGEDYAMQGIDQTPIRDGDCFSLVYTD